MRFYSLLRSPALIPPTKAVYHQPNPILQFLFYLLHFYFTSLHCPTTILISNLRHSSLLPTLLLLFGFLLSCFLHLLYNRSPHSVLFPLFVNAIPCASNHSLLFIGSPSHNHFPQRGHLPALLICPRYLTAFPHSHFAYLSSFILFLLVFLPQLSLYLHVLKSFSVVIIIFALVLSVWIRSIIRLGLEYFGS